MFNVKNVKKDTVVLSFSRRVMSNCERLKLPKSGKLMLLAGFEPAQGDHNGFGLWPNF